MYTQLYSGKLQRHRKELYCMWIVMNEKCKWKVGKFARRPTAHVPMMIFECVGDEYLTLLSI